MKAVVTGAAGFIGSQLSARLLDAGAEVLGIDSFTDYYDPALKRANVSDLTSRRGFELLEARIQDVSWADRLDGVTHVFHLAAQAGVRRSWGQEFSHYTACNVEATQALLEACVDHPLERFVYSSSSSVYGDAAEIPMREDVRVQPVSPYGVTKLAAEHLCHLYWTNFNVPTVSLRYFTVYGPRQRPDMAFHRFIRAILRGEPITLYGDGEQTRDFTFVADAVTANVAAGDRGVPGGVYNIGGGSRVSMNEVLSLMARCTGREPDVTREPVQKGDMRDTYADTTRARRDLAFSPSIDLESGLRAEYEWMQHLLQVTS